MNKIPIYLITGFLGSGKTTFIKNIITYYSDTKKIAIVQNEFAPANFDGQDLKRTTDVSFDILEINNGSVFCVCLLSGFIESLHQFVIKHNPEIIIMEASGLSDPVSIGQLFNSPKLQENIYLAGTICIVDSRNMDKFDKLMTRIHHQLQIADIVLINKADLVANSDRALNEINTLNPFATKFITTHCTIPLDEVFSNCVTQQKKIFLLPENSIRPDIQSAVYKTAKPLKNGNEHSFINQVIIKTIRLKGHILLDNSTTLAVQSIADELHTEIMPHKTRQTELIAMGYGITINEIKALYQAFS